MKSFVRSFMMIVILLIIGMVIFKVALVFKSINSGVPVYSVTVNSYGGYEEYLTKEFTKDEKTGCITFKDELGVKRIVCNEYTITEY